MTSVWISPELSPAASGWLAAPDRAAPPAEAGPMQPFLLRRSGSRPVAFNGMLMIEHAGESAPGLRRHVVRLYETDRDSIVIEVALEAPGGDRLSHIVIAEAGSLDEAEAFLAAYDPAGETPFVVAPAAEPTSLTIAAHARLMEAEATRLRDDFHAVREAVFPVRGDDAFTDGPSIRTN
jgi:hypothetical protein